MKRRRRLSVLLVCTFLSLDTACAGDPIAPFEEPEEPEASGCRTPAPEEGMICRGDVWGWN